MQIALHCRRAEWLHLTSLAEAEQVGADMGNAVSVYFQRDNVVGNSPSDYYALRLSNPPPGQKSLAVALRIPRDRTRQVPASNGLSGIIVVGPHNTDPYPRFSPYIHALASHLCVPLPGDCYPYHQAIQRVDHYI
jgi:hypothetical protein